MRAGTVLLDQPETHCGWSKSTVPLREEVEGWALDLATQELVVEEEWAMPGPPSVTRRPETWT